MTILTEEKAYSTYLKVSELYNSAFNNGIGEEAVDYLSNRGISKDLANRFLVGFAPKDDNRHFIYDKMIRTKKFSVQELLQLNVLKADIEQAKIYDYFGVQRIIFPVFENGNIVSFSSRSILNNVEPRYKTLKYKKVGIYNSDIIKASNRIYITEGAIDTLSMLSMGFPAIGILGLSSFGREHLKVFDGYKGEVIIVFDSDENGSGLKGVQRVGTILHNYGINRLYFKTLPRKPDQKKMDINLLLTTCGHYEAQNIILNTPDEKFVPVIEDYAKLEKARIYLNEPNIYDVVSRYTTLTQEGPQRFRCVCPLPSHNDSKPSFMIYEDSNRFKCFGCSEYGGPLRFIMLMEGITYEDAARKACSMKG